MRLPRPIVAWLGVVVLVCTVHATEDSPVKEDYIAGAMRDATRGFKPTQEARRQELQHVGISVRKRSMESQAAEMLETEEKNEEIVQKQTTEYHRKYSHGPSLGEPADNGPTAPWVVDDKIAKRKEATRKQEDKIKEAMDTYDAKYKGHQQRATKRASAQTTDQISDGPDLGESAGVGVVASDDANALTARAQARAQAQARLHEKATALSRAKQIANRVRKLVKQQQQAEKTAGAQVKGSVLGKAVEEHDKADHATAQDQMLAHKLEDEQTQNTMMHLIESERKEQRKEFEQERQMTHSTLAKIRKKLHAQQDAIVKSMKVSAVSEEKKIQKHLGNTRIAQTIENVVKKKLASRLGQLQKSALKTVSDVSAQVAALKSRVRRLRREQTRMKVAEAQLQYRHTRDLGESAGTSGTSALQAEVAQLRMQMMQQQQQQQQMASPAAASEHVELMKLRKQMSEMQQQNNLFRKMLATKARARLTQASRPQYTTADLQNYFIHKNNAVRDLKTEVVAEKHRLSDLETKLSSQQTSTPPVNGAQFFVQVAEGAEDEAMPLYNQRAEQARVEMEELQKRAQEDVLGLDEPNE